MGRNKNPAREMRRPRPRKIWLGKYGTGQSYKISQKIFPIIETS